MVVTMMGKMPSIALETLVGHDLILINENWPRLLISLFFTGVIYILMKKKVKNH